jgi:arginase
LRRRLDLIGAPSSAGAYAPGQERAPAALRSAGLLASLRERGISVADRGDVPGFRWQVDRAAPRAMNGARVATIARHVAARVATSLADGAAVLVLGGDCTVEIGTVVGASVGAHRVGLVYVDLDTDLKTPETTDDGALDWMGVAHLLGLPGTDPVVAGVGARTPILAPDQVLLFAADNITDSERWVIDSRGIEVVRLAEVAADATGAARDVVERWASRVDRLVVHVDVDVLDYLELPIAENTRRNRGLAFPALVAALRELVGAPNFVALTVCEVNPDHGALDGSTLRTFIGGIADALAS